MATQFACIEDKHAAFIGKQKIFFAASAAEGARVNLSPRGTDTFRILGPNDVLWLDRTGSSNETAAHLRVDGRLTVMFCAFAGPPLILRLYGRGRIVARGSAEYADLLDAEFDGREPPGARQMVRLAIDLVQTSCGYGVPKFDHVEDRDTLDRWAQAKTDTELDAYRRKKNAVSMDGLPTGLFDEPEAPRETRL